MKSSLPLIKTYDIKSALPTVAEALAELRLILFANRKKGIIKIIQGYGSTGKGGSIKKMVHKLLQEETRLSHIEGFIPGEATVSLIGYDQLIRKYLQVLKNDNDFKKGNDGITYVITRS